MHPIVALWLAIAAFTSVVEVPHLTPFDEPDRRAVVACAEDGRATIAWSPYPTLEEWAARFREAAGCAGGSGGPGLAEADDVTCREVEGRVLCSGRLH